MPKLGTLRPRIGTLDTRSLKPPLKEADADLSTPEYQAWRAKVIARAGSRCQAIHNGLRCTKARPEHRMYADHIKERRDGGALYDAANGQCLCGAHHTAKTIAERKRRALTSHGPTDEP